MTGYTEGKHDDPADSKDRLLKVGTKYQATAPSVADGDNVYVLVDSAGRPIVVGPAASGAAEVGSPLQVGGSVDDTSPTSVDEGDVRRFRSTPEGNQIVELYKDNGALSPIAAMPGASEVKSDRYTTASDSSVRATFLTPTSGKKIRITSIINNNSSATSAIIELYFGTGATLATDGTKAISQVRLDLTDQPSIVHAWPDGGGPVGATDDVVSIRTDADLTTNVRLVVQYREE